MNIGFDSPEQAQKEIDKLQKEYDKRWSGYTDEEIQHMCLNGTRACTSMVGRDYKVEPVKLMQM